MISNITETQGTIYPACEKEFLVGSSSQSVISILTKVNSCFGTFKSVHYNCALKFSKLTDKDYKLETKIYVNNTSSPLSCMNS